MLAFDLLYFDGHAIRGLELIARQIACKLFWGTAQRLTAKAVTEARAAARRNMRFIGIAPNCRRSQERDVKSSKRKIPAPPDTSDIKKARHIMHRFIGLVIRHSSLR